MVEVISLGSAIYDRNTKADTYAMLGVRDLWLIDEMNQTVEARNNVDERFGPGAVFHRGEILASSVFPDLNLPVDKLFIN